MAISLGVINSTHMTVFMNVIVQEFFFKSINGIGCIGIVESKKGEGRKKDLF